MLKAVERSPGEYHFNLMDRVVQCPGSRLYSRYHKSCKGVCILCICCKSLLCIYYAHQLSYLEHVPYISVYFINDMYTIICILLLGAHNI